MNPLFQLNKFKAVLCVETWIALSFDHRFTNFINMKGILTTLGLLYYYSSCSTKTVIHLYPLALVTKLDYILTNEIEHLK